MSSTILGLYICLFWTEHSANVGSMLSLLGASDVKESALRRRVKVVTTVHKDKRRPGTCWQETHTASHSDLHPAAMNIP